MQTTFYKYQGTGNDFVIIDNRQLFFDKNDTNYISELCDRRFGIGADGLILLENHPTLDFKMVYFNADGNESSMCGNGGRCMVKFARFLNIIEDSAQFEAIDGVHDAKISADKVYLKMNDVSNIMTNRTDFVLDTGSPHYVANVENIKDLNVKEKGASIRYSESYKAEGINVNFVEPLGDSRFAVRTYERGVEAETLSCGTGVTAVALAMHKANHTESNIVSLKTEGGELQVQFEESEGKYYDIWLIGPAEQVFKGELQQ
ncbi:MAG: diaminopimelate epimerase [bacterium]